MSRPRHASTGLRPGGGASAGRSSAAWVVAAVVAGLAIMSLPARSDASTWTVGLVAGSSGQSQAIAFPAPTGVVASCGGLLGPINLKWNAVTHATSYTVDESSTSATSGYGFAAMVTTTSWSTGGHLGFGSYWFEVIANVGTHWASPASAASNGIHIALLLCT
ncbi:MAG: hypothetical protein ACRDY0_00990 [Acidimicrobiales bacterium]